VIILDTNVLSAFMRPTPDRPVIEWLDRQPSESVWTSSVTIFEIVLGIGIMPEGRNRAFLQAALDRLLAQIIEGRILPFDTAAAQAAAALSAARRREGRSQEFRDSMIAGIVIARRATLATRYNRHFGDLPVPVVNPWTD
jgi:toxin FitB